jgi:hypothetical protein
MTYRFINPTSQLALPKNFAVLGQNTHVLHPKRTRQDTKTLSMWGSVGVLKGSSP